jgi:hypothetical protein
VHRDSGEEVQHPGGVHGLGAAFAVRSEQHRIGGGSGVNPVIGAGDEEPGLVEVSASIVFDTTVPSAASGSVSQARRACEKNSSRTKHSRARTNGVTSGFAL